MMDKMYSSQQTPNLRSMIQILPVSYPKQIIVETRYIDCIDISILIKNIWIIYKLVPCEGLNTTPPGDKYAKS